MSSVFDIGRGIIEIGLVQVQGGGLEKRPTFCFCFAAKAAYPLFLFGAAQSQPGKRLFVGKDALRMATLLSCSSTSRLVVLLSSGWPFRSSFFALLDTNSSDALSHLPGSLGGFFGCLPF